MAEFLEERLPINVRAGASYSDDFEVEIVSTANGNEYRRLVHPYPRRIYTIFYTQVKADLWDDILSLYYRTYGMYAGFRVKALDDFTTNGRILAPTALDQTLTKITDSTYQLVIAYGGSGTPISLGKPVRNILKPVASTTLVSIDALNVPVTTMWSVNTATGVITFVNKTKTITDITKAASAVITVGTHTFVEGESVYIYGVSGMTQINGKRGTITAKTSTKITVDIDSTSYSTYTSGGTAQTAPYSADEVVYGGCEFDIPCRFNSRIDVKSLSPGVRETSEIEIIELLNL